MLPDGKGGYAMGWRAEPPVVGLDNLADPAALLRQIWGQLSDQPAEFWGGYASPLLDPVAGQGGS